MPTYRVFYTIDLEADSPQETAIKAERLLRSDDPERFRPIFEIYEWQGGTMPCPPLDGLKPVTVDLSDLQTARRDYPMQRKNKSSNQPLQDNLNRLLVGKQIVDAFYANDGDHELVIVLPGDAALTVQRDEEGNGPGALHHLTSKKGRTELIVIPGSAPHA